MAHTRNRHVVTTLSKKLRFSPVVTLQGVRQCGKSFLVRELLPKSLQRAHYETFDRLVTRDFATTNPETFLLRYEESAPLIIDEAQKVPEIFDAIKYEVDKKRTPGKFLLLGSTEFSKMTHVSESLTGRMSRIRVFPLSLSETLDLPPRRIRLLDPFSKLPRVERGHLVKYLDHGGMPAIFSIRNVHEMQQAFDDWVTLTVERDLKQIPGFKFDSKLARQILERVATLDEPTAGRIASALGKDPRTIMKHLEAFETLFVLHKILPFTGSTGKPQYYLCDVGIAKFLGASFPRLLETTLLLHILSAISWQMESRKHLSFYRTSKGSQVSLLITEGAQTTAIRILAEERFDLRNIAILLALRDKFPTMKTIVLGPERLSLRKEKVEIYPWESMD